MDIESHTARQTMNELSNAITDKLGPKMEEMFEDFEWAEDQTITGWFMQSRSKQLGISAIDLAERLGVSRAYVYSMFKGTRKPSFQMRNTLCNELEISDAELIALQAADNLNE